MRSFIIVFAILIGMHTSIAQKKGAIPQAAKDAFAKAYPTVSKVKWENEKGSYEASFTYQDHKMSVLYNADGRLMETETAIPIEKLPAQAKKYAEGKGKIKETARIVRADGAVVYEAEVNHTDLLFDEKGNYLESRKD